MAKKQIVQMKGADGTIQYPKSVAKAIEMGAGKGTLEQKLLELDVFTQETNTDKVHEISGTEYPGFRVGGASDNKLHAQSDFTVKAFELNPKFIYVLKGQTTAKFLSSLAVAIKATETGSGNDFILLTTQDIESHYPYAGTGGLPLPNAQGVMDYMIQSHYTITPIYYRTDNSKQIYLLINYKWGKQINNAILFDGVNNSNNEDQIILKPKGIIDNYDYIKSRAVVVGDGMSKNLFSAKYVNDRIGLSSTNADYIPDNDYTSVFIPLDFDTYYTISGYNFTELGGNKYAKCIAMGRLDTKGCIQNLRVSDFINRTWLSSPYSEIFINKEDNIYAIGAKLQGGVFTFRTPRAEDVDTLKVGIIINISWKGLPDKLADGLQVEKGTIPTGHDSETSSSVSIFGYRIYQSTTDPLPGHTGLGDKISGKTGLFLGDSITELVTGYVSVVNRILKLGKAINKGKWGDDTRGLVDIVTGLNIRGRQSTSIDYSVVDFATIQIGTNQYAPTGDLAKDIPNISIYDIKKYPFEYNNPDGTVQSATLNDDNDYFKKCFPDTFYGNLALAIEYIRYKNPNCRIYLITIPQSMSSYKKVRQMILDVADCLCVPVIDAQKNCCLDYRSRSKWTDGSVHPAPYGIELWGAYIANELYNRYYTSEAIS